MLYLCAIEWGWIAQRPHFLAEELSEYYDIVVASPKHLLKRLSLQKNTKKPKKYRTFYLVPYQEKVKILGVLSEILFKIKIGSLDSYDIIWVGSPLFNRYIPKSYKGRVVYDYMDDYVSMQKGDKLQKVYRDAHLCMTDRADVIVASSSYLLNKLSDKVRPKAYVVRNAFRGNEILAPKRQRHDRTIKLGYIGTISSWMDWDLIQKSLDKFGNIEYHFWGPKDVNMLFDNRCIYHGIAEHSSLTRIVKDIDVMIMPFVVNDIVKAVDPVKLYEYISYGKQIICCEYDEVERFRDYVWLYDDEKTFFKYLRDISDGNLEMKYNKATQEKFLSENSWRCRAQQIYGIVQ